MPHGRRPTVVRDLPAGGRPVVLVWHKRIRRCAETACGDGRRASSIYACDECDSRCSGVPWCNDCNRPCRRIGTGGQCPECDHPLTIDELLTAVPS